MMQNKYVLDPKDPEHPLDETPDNTKKPITAEDILPQRDVREIVGSYFEPNADELVVASHAFPGFFSAQFEKKMKSMVLEFVLKRNLDGLTKYLATMENMGITAESLILKKGNATDLAGLSFEDISPLQAAFLRHDPQMATFLLQKMNLNNTQIQASLEAIGPIPTYESLPECDDEFEFLAQLISNTNDADLQAVLKFDWRKPDEEGPDCPLNHALKAFRKHFSVKGIYNPRHNNTNEQTNHYWFNPKPLIKACCVNDNNGGVWWSHDQYQVFGSLVIGYLQRSLPAVYRQAIRQGLYGVTQKNESLDWASILIANSFCEDPNCRTADRMDRLGRDLLWSSQSYGVQVKWSNGVGSNGVGSLMLKNFVEQTLSHLVGLHNTYCLLAPGQLQLEIPDATFSNLSPQ